MVISVPSKYPKKPREIEPTGWILHQLCKVCLHAYDPVILLGSYVYSTTTLLDTVAFIYCVYLRTTCHYLD